MEPALPISVVIPTMNRPDSLDRTLAHMSKGSDRPSQIVIIDQSSEESTRGKIKCILDQYQGAFDEIIYKYLAYPSLTRARNIGFELVTNDIIVCSDDDIDVNDDTLTNLYKIFENDKRVALIAGIDELTSRSSTNIGYLLGTKSYFKRHIGHVTKSMLGRYPDDISTQVETQWAQGYFFAIRKKYVDKWGCKWDENLTGYAYAEDLDFSYGYYKSAKSEGLVCVLDPGVRVRHLATIEYRIPSEKNVCMYVINRAYLGWKHRMGIDGYIMRQWCNLWRFVQALVSHQHPKMFMRAMWCAAKYRNEIAAGHIDYDKYINKQQ